MPLHVPAIASFLTAAGLASGLAITAVPATPVNPVQPISPEEITAPSADPERRERSERGRDARPDQPDAGERKQLRSRLATALRGDELERATLVELVSALELRGKVSPQQIAAALWQARSGLSGDELERFLALVERAGPRAALQAVAKWKQRDAGEPRGDRGHGDEQGDAEKAGSGRPEAKAGKKAHEGPHGRKGPGSSRPDPRRDPIR